MQSLEGFVPVKKYDSQEYLGMFRHLLPKGIIWGFKINKIATNLFQDSVLSPTTWNDSPSSSNVVQDTIATPEDTQPSTDFLGILFSAFASELSRIDSAGLFILKESIAGNAEVLLEDWERLLGIVPPEGATLEERQQACHALVYSDASVGLFAEFFIDYASRFGFVITITSGSDISKPFCCAPIGVDSWDIGSRMNDRLNDSGQTSTVIFTIVSGTGNVELMKSEIEKFTPTHLNIVWA